MPNRLDGPRLAESAIDAPPCESIYEAYILNPMVTTKVFRSGNSQAVRIPREFQLKSGEIEIVRRDDEIVLKQQPVRLGAAFRVLTGFSDDFFDGGRKQPRQNKRAKF